MLKICSMKVTLRIFTTFIISIHADSASYDGHFHFLVTVLEHFRELLDERYAMASLENSLEIWNSHTSVNVSSQVRDKYHSAHLKVIKYINNLLCSQSF